MTFFPPDPEIPEPEERESVQPRWWQAPEDELPVRLPFSQLLASTDHLAIVLAGVAVHSDGVLLRVDRALRRAGLPLDDWNDLSGLFMENMAFGGRAHVEGRLRFGVVLADGQKVLADAFPYFGGVDPMEEPAGHVLSRRQQAGGGGESMYSTADHLWIWPLPPAGSIELVLQWPAVGVDETHVTLDLGDVASLAARARPYWPR